MKFLEADFTLYEIERTLEERFSSQEKPLRTIGDLDLSYEDYKYLVFKLKGLTKYITRIEVFEQYKLSLVTALVFAIRYEEDTKHMCKEIRKFLRQFQQHHVRFFVRICMNVFSDLGLSIYGNKFRSVDDVFELAAIHANLTEETVDVVFQILEEYYSRGDTFLLEGEVYEKLDRALYKAYPFLKKRVTHFEYSKILKGLYESCFVEHASLDQLIKEYNQVSVQVIESCYAWYMKFSNTATRLIKIR